jgi:hypothetical protein
VNVRVIASRPATSDQPASPCSADFRASADSRSAMIASSLQWNSILPLSVTPRFTLSIQPPFTFPPVTMTHM